MGELPASVDKDDLLEKMAAALRKAIPGATVTFAEHVDDADHAEYVDPVDHTHDAPISSATLLERLQAVLDVHSCDSDGNCAAEPHVVHPCPTARAALGIAK